jgi:hypothetical protein
MPLSVPGGQSRFPKNLGYAGFPNKSVPIHQKPDPEDTEGFLERGKRPPFIPLMGTVLTSNQSLAVYALDPLRPFSQKRF